MNLYAIMVQNTTLVALYTRKCYLKLLKKLTRELSLVEIANQHDTSTVYCECVQMNTPVVTRIGIF